MDSSTPVAGLKNIGATLASRLEEIGVFTRADLENIGSIEAYQRLNQLAGKKLPVCYYLYSLEAGLRDMDWRELSDQDKQALIESD